MQSQTLAIDFGTSNSAVALAHAGGVWRVPIEHGAETLPTAVFFPADGGAMRIGASAAEALISGEEGRYMRALKSVLGQPLLHEKRLIGGRRRSLAEIISAFLTELRARTEAATGQRFSRVLSGRPVHFYTADPQRDMQAEDDLRDCYLAAGFHDVAFLPEPEAAALACQGCGAISQIGLVVDIGGGTSDFSVFRSTEGRAEILASHGIRLGGTDFDHAVSMLHAMPLLGLGGQLRREMGAGVLPVPRAPFVDLATWAKIPFLYSPETRRMAESMARLAVEPEKMGRLVAVLEHELGHELAFSVERGKIDANRRDTAAGHIRMEFLEPGLAAKITPQGLNEALAPNRDLLRAAAAETISAAGIQPGAIGRIILVGGSSLMSFVAEEMQMLCPKATVQRSAAFTAVVDGLALATRPTP